MVPLILHCTILKIDRQNFAIAYAATVMAIYTGNNGRVYIARRESSGLTGTRTLSIVTGQSINAGDILTAITIRGNGSGARLRADNTVLLNDATRTCTFTVVDGGEGYESTDIISLSRYSSNVWVRMTEDFDVGTILTRGVDSEAEIINDNYRIAKIRDWSYTSNSEVIETTALGDVAKTFAPSITSGDGSATLMFYEDEINNYTANNPKDIFELVDILFPRDVPPRVILNLAVDSAFSIGSNNANLWKTNFLFNAYITSASVSVSYGEVVTVATNFTVDGPLIDVPWKPNVVRL